MLFMLYVLSERTMPHCYDITYFHTFFIYVFFLMFQ